MQRSSEEGGVQAGYPGILQPASLVVHFAQCTRCADEESEDESLAESGSEELDSEDELSDDSRPKVGWLAPGPMLGCAAFEGPLSSHMAGAGG